MKSNVVQMPDGPRPVNEEPPPDDFEHSNDDDPNARPKSADTPNSGPRSSILDQHWIDLSLGKPPLQAARPPATR